MANYDYKTLSLDEIESYCKENNQVEWYVKTIETFVEDKKSGELREITFIELKKAFVEKFMPDLKPPKKPKPLTMRERAAALKNSL